MTYMSLSVTYGTVVHVSDQNQPHFSKSLIEVKNYSGKKKKKAAEMRAGSYMFLSIFWPLQ